MKTALVLGGGDTLQKDLEALHALGISYDGVFACNEAGATWNGDLEAWVSLHPEKFNKWAATRTSKGYSEAPFWAHRQPDLKIAPPCQVASYKFPEQKISGSSGLFAAKVALVDFGYVRAILCGIPMTSTPHFFDDVDWKGAKGFRNGWHEVPTRYKNRMRSMSGWTRVLLGSPSDWANERAKRCHQ